ncbi:MAG: DUF1572 family protein [Phycisphaerales bacterium]
MERRDVVQAFESEFAAVRATCEKAIAQLDAGEIRRGLDEQSNSVAVILKHVGGNLRSRFTDFLTDDGEKSWRRRDDEFVDDFPEGEAGRAAALERWNEGWSVALDALARLSDADLDRVVTIRGEPHRVARALARSLAHVAYHAGQIVQTARTIVGEARWTTITIPRGRSDEFNRRMGYRPNA